MEWLTDPLNFNLSFNQKEATIMHIDLNSCFASVEQQANVALRGKPVAVAAYTTPRGCIIAASIEAKRRGVKTGMRVREGKLLCPDLVVVAPDPEKYRNVHASLRRLLGEYTDKVTPASIDEFYLDLEGYPAMERGMMKTGVEIKRRIREEIGEALLVSIGVGPNRFLAKTAANLVKPDGLVKIDRENFGEVYGNLKLTGLCGIKTNNAVRLGGVGIFTVRQFYEAGARTLVGAFGSVTGFYWYLRLRGWEVDDVEWGERVLEIHLRCLGR